MIHAYQSQLAMTSNNSKFNEDAMCFHVKTNPFAPSGQWPLMRCVAGTDNLHQRQNVAINVAMHMYKQLI